METKPQSNDWKAQRAEMRYLRRRGPRAYKEVERLRQSIGDNPNRSPQTVVDKLKEMKLTGQTDARGLDLRGADTREAGALDRFDLSGVQTDTRTVIGRAVGAKFDGAQLSGRIMGDINGSSMRRTRQIDLTAPGINRDNIDESGSIQARVDYSGGSSRNRKSVNVNAYLVSRDGSDNSGSVTHGGWLTQCYNEDTLYNGAKIINTGIGGSTFDRLRGDKMEFRPKSREDGFSVCGMQLTNSKVNPLIAHKAFEDNATLTNCTIAHEAQTKLETKAEMKPEAKAHNPFAALNEFHRDALAAKDAVSSLTSFAAHRPRVTSTLGALCLG